MRLLHTSDWHLGQHFMGKSRQAEHQALLDWLLAQVEEQAVDAVLIAGDVFDTGTPPSYARELYNQLVLRLHHAGVALVVLGGNHDSVAVLGESRELLARLGTWVVPAASGSDDPAAQVITLPRRDGTPGCLLCAVPFIRPRDVLTSQAGQSAEEKQQSLQQAIAEHYAAVHAAAEARREELATTLGRRLPIIASGHLTTVGASANDSVREIYVGALEAFPTAAFPPVAYLALGHIHRPQKVGGQEHLRYSGSPIPLGFDEAKQEKEMLLVELGEAEIRVTPLPVPRFQPLIAIKTDLARLPTAIATAAAHGTAALPVWLEVCITTDDYLADLPERVQAACQGWAVEVLRVRRDRGTAAAQLTTASQETLDELDPGEVFARRLALEALDEPLQAELLQRYRQVVASITAPAADQE